jgi:hypothetical protein
MTGFEMLPRALARTGDPKSSAIFDAPQSRLRRRSELRRFTLTASEKQHAITLGTDPTTADMNAKTHT